MKKRYAILIILILVSMLILSGCSDRNRRDGLGANLGKWVEKTQKSIARGDPAGLVVARIFIFTFIFALLFGASEIGLGGLARNSRIAICIAIAGLSALGMPRYLVMTLVLSYQGFAFLIMINTSAR